MKIYQSTTHVQEPIGTRYYQLNVISQWDWHRKACCYKGDISYSLWKCVRISDTESRIEIVSDLTNEIREELIEMGYTLAGRENWKKL